MAVVKLSPYKGVATVMSTELNALAITTGKAISAAQFNGPDTSDSSLNGDFFADLELAVDFVTAPTAGTVIELYLLRSIDGGVTYPDGSASVTPQSNLYAGGFAVRNTNAAQVLSLPGVSLPPEYYKYLIQNTTNQPFPATGSTLRENTYQILTV